MTTRAELLRERLRLTDQERAELKIELNDPNRVPREVKWLDDGPDPFGMNWEWVELPKEDTNIDPLSPPKAVTSDTSRTQSFEVISDKNSSRHIRIHRWLLSISAVAASLLLGLGLGYSLFSGQRTTTNRADTFSIALADISATYPPARGGRVAELDIRNASELGKFATVITLPRMGMQRLFPIGSKDGIEISPRSTASSGPLDEEADVAVVILTDKPATKFLRDTLRDSEYDSKTVNKMLQVITDALKRRGERSIEYGVTLIRPEAGAEQPE